LEGFGEQAIKSLSKIDPVSRQEYPANFYAQHGLASPSASAQSPVLLKLIRQHPTRSSTPLSADEEGAGVVCRSTTDNTCGAAVIGAAPFAVDFQYLVWVHETPQAFPRALADTPASKAATNCLRRTSGIRRLGPCTRRKAANAATTCATRSLSTLDRPCGFNWRMASTFPGRH
jgi:hypothetical protein